MSMTRSEWFIAIGMYSLAALFLCYEMAVQVSPSIMTFQLMRDFQIQHTGLGVMAAFYFYSYTLMQIPAGLLYDHFGPRTLLTVASIICALGALFFAFTATVYWAAFGRFLMGLGSSFAFIGVLVVAARWFDGFYFAFLVGIAQLLAAIGAIAGEVPLAFMVNHIGWRETMYWLVAVGFVLAFLCLFVLKDRPKHEHHEVMTREHSLRRHLGQVLERSQTWAFAIYAFCGWGPMSVFASLWGVPFLMNRYNVPNTLAAFAIMMMWLGLGILSPFVGWFSNLIGRRKPILWVGSLVGLSASLLLLYTPGLPFWVAFVLLFLMGIASAAHILTFALVRDINRHSVIATGIGVNNMAVVIGGALLQPLVGGILSHLWDGHSLINGIQAHATSDYQIALLVVPILFFIGFLTAVFFVKETRCRPSY